MSVERQKREWFTIPHVGGPIDYEVYEETVDLGDEARTIVPALRFEMPRHVDSMQMLVSVADLRDLLAAVEGNA